MRQRSPQTRQCRDIARKCIASRLRLVNRVITNLYDDALRPLGIKVSQMNILVVAESSGLGRPADLCRTLQLDASTLSRNLERMRARGWLEIVPDDDARAQPFRLTRKGRQVLRSGFPAWKAAQKRAETLLGEAGLAILDRWSGDLATEAR